MSVSDKQSWHGFYDVRSPASRTTMCASCHIGDPERGRLVTHAMYAAGHPPLPAFEVETFMRDMPPHWRVLNTAGQKDTREDALQYKAADVTIEFLAATQDAYYKGLSANTNKPAEYNSSFDRTRSLAVGALVTWAHSAKVVAALASGNDYPLLPANENRWPELAAFECAACHHDLKVDGWRARRNPPTTPGRPLLRDWSSPLFEAVAQSVTDSGEVLTVVREAEAAIDRTSRHQPYGDSAVIADKLKHAATKVHEKAKAIEAQPIDKATAVRILRNIAKVGSARPLDYESARHLVWGFDEVLREIDPSSKSKKGAAMLKQMKGMFVTDLATSDVRTPANIPLPGVEPRKALLINLPPMLEKAANYDANKLRNLFVQLDETLHSAAK